MTRDDITRVAREFGWAQKDIDSLLYIVETAAAAEREACAKVAEAYEPRCDTCPSGVATAIRARGQQ
jgi:hypothetical protein